MKTCNLDFNLDDEVEVKEFIDAHGTTAGIILAHKLGISGKGSKRKAWDLSFYAWNKITAIDLRKRGEIQTAIKYESICHRIYSESDFLQSMW
jgi:hypothetical protein